MVNFLKPMGPVKDKVPEPKQYPETPEVLQDETAPAKVDPMDPAPLIQLFDSFNVEIVEMLAKANGHEVTDEASHKTAVEMTTQAKILARDITSTHADLKKPYLNVTRELDAFKKRLVDRLSAIQMTVNGKIRPWLQMLERKRLAKERERQAEQARQQAKLEADARATREAEAAKKGVDIEKIPEPTPVVAVMPATQEVKTVVETGTVKLATKMVPKLVSVADLDPRCIKARFAEIEKAVLPWARAQVKADDSITHLAGFEIEEQVDVQTRVTR